LFSKIDVRIVVRDHLGTLRQGVSGGAPERRDLLLFFGIPAVPLVVLPILGIWLTNSSIGTLETAISVFAALLFNLLVLIYEVGRREQSVEERSSGDQSKAEVRREFLQQVHYNVAFAILVSLVLIVVLLPGVLVESKASLVFSSVCFYYLGTVFLLTLLMVLKRMHILLKDEYQST
jgi:FtsH-binding integral membrane protein